MKKQSHLEFKKNLQSKAFAVPIFLPTNSKERLSLKLRSTALEFNVQDLLSDLYLNLNTNGAKSPFQKARVRHGPSFVGGAARVNPSGQHEEATEEVQWRRSSSMAPW